jgi:hypothetical protein
MIDLVIKNKLKFWNNGFKTNKFEVRESNRDADGISDSIG